MRPPCFAKRCLTEWQTLTGPTGAILDMVASGGRQWNTVESLLARLGEVGHSVAAMGDRRGRRECRRWDRATGGWTSYLSWGRIRGWTGGGTTLSGHANPWASVCMFPRHATCQVAESLDLPRQAAQSGRTNHPVRPSRSSSKSLVALWLSRINASDSRRVRAIIWGS